MRSLGLVHVYCQRQAVSEPARTATRRSQATRFPWGCSIRVAVKIATNYLPISARPTNAAKSPTAFRSPETKTNTSGAWTWLQNSKHTLFGRYFVDAFKNPADLRRQESADHHAGRQPRDGAVGDHRRQLHLRPGNAELVPRHLQPPAR